MSAPIARGSVVRVGLDPTVGHEQAGTRPAVVVSDMNLPMRYRMVGIVPLTGTPQSGALYPRVQPSPSNGLTKPSYALVDQLRSVDPQRIQWAAGPVDGTTLGAIDSQLRKFLGL